MIDNYQKTVFDRRAAIMIFGTGILTSVLVLQMLNLQVFNKKKYKKLAENNSYKIKVEIPKRGIIYDQNGIELAKDEQVYRLYVIPKELNNFEETVNFLRRSLKLTENNIKRIQKLYKKQRNFQPILISEKIQWEKMAELSALNIPGVHIEQGYTRRYPDGPLAAHVLGYLSEPKDSLIPFFKTGISGLEKTYNNILMGKTGRTVNISNAEGQIVGVDGDQSFPAHSGESLQTTIITSVQKTLEQELLKMQSGCGVVLDAETGDIYAMASLPSFNADLFGSELGDDYIDNLSNNAKKPFLNKVLDGLYPPGSVFKIVVALAGLETGAIKPTDKIFCTGSWAYSGNIYHCWEHQGHGSVDLTDALKHSCDIYFYQMSLKIGIEAIVLMSQRLGLGQNSFDNYPDSEKVGVIPTREWKETNIGSTWVHGDTIITSIGQGFVLSNCMQLAVMLGAAVTNYKIKPRLTYDKKINKDYIGLQQPNIDALSKGLAAVLENGGTASGSAINIRGIKMGGKTGTSQVRRISMQEREEGVRTNDSLPWDLRNHGLFVCYAPLKDPKFIIAMIAEHAGASGPVAHAASAVMRELINAGV